jgi:hypothetical protein
MVLSPNEVGSMIRIVRRSLPAAVAILCLTILCFFAEVRGAEKSQARAGIKSVNPYAPLVVDGVRFLPSPKHERMLVGGRIAGSNDSPTEGFELLAEISSEPKAGQWTVLQFKNKTPYRWVRYELSPESGGKIVSSNNIAQFEFVVGSRKLNGPRFFDSGMGQFVVIDLGEQASTQRVFFSPNAADLRPQRAVTLRSRTPGATIRYTLDGTTPTATSLTYTAPLELSGRTTISAVAFSKGLAPSPVSYATYHNGTRPDTIKSFHVGNSLTGNAVRFPVFAETAGIKNQSAWFLIGGAYTVKLWKAKEGADKERFQKAYAQTAFPLDHLTLQPRDFDIDEEVENERNFINFIRERSPNVQSWLYAEWVERDRRRPSDRGSVPSYQMKKLFPAATWEESMSAMLLYVEEVQHRLKQLDKEGKPARILPCSLALGLVRNLIDEGQLPGVPKGEVSFYRTFFADTVHVNLNGCYLVDLIWYAAFTGQSPEGKLLPIETTLTPAQAQVLQHLAWEIVKNYPDCGLYQEGTTPAATPQLSVPSGPIGQATPIHLSSATPGVFYRYTLDGTIPTRTRGYVYCGVITAQPGMTIKAMAYKSGLGDSGVAESSYPAGERRAPNSK